MVTLAAWIVVASFVWFVVASIFARRRERELMAAAFYLELQWQHDERQARERAAAFTAAKERAEFQALELRNHRQRAQHVGSIRRRMANEIRRIRAGELRLALPERRDERAKELAHADELERTVPTHLVADLEIRAALDEVALADLVEPVVTVDRAKIEQENLEQAMTMALGLDELKSLNRRGGN